MKRIIEDEESGDNYKLQIKVKLTRLPASRSSSVGPEGRFLFFHPKVKVKETRYLFFFGILGVGWSEGVNKCIQADFKTDPGLENCPKFVGVVEQNKIQRTYFHTTVLCMQLYRKI